MDAHIVKFVFDILVFFLIILKTFSDLAFYLVDNKAESQKLHNGLAGAF